MRKTMEDYKNRSPGNDCNFLLMAAIPLNLSIPKVNARSFFELSNMMVLLLIKLLLFRTKVVKNFIQGAILWRRSMLGAAIDQR